MASRGEEQEPAGVTRKEPQNFYRAGVIKSDIKNTNAVYPTYVHTPRPITKASVHPNWAVWSLDSGK